MLSRPLAIRFLVAVLAFGLLAAGCGSGDGGSADNGAAADDAIGGLDPDEVSRLVDSRLRVEVDGDVSFTYEDDVELRTVTIDEPEVSSLRFFSTGLENVKPIGDGRVFRIAIDLVGLWDGPGQYQIPKTGEARTAPTVDPDNPDANAAGSGLSKVYLTYNGEGDFTQNPVLARETKSFEFAQQPCQVTIGDNGENGKLECPEVAESGGQVVRITMEWEKR